MLAPHELKNKTFTKAMRGYNPQEVDEYIEFLIEAYTNLYRENSELERKLKVVVTNLDEIRDEEENIRATLLKSQKLGEKIIRDANEKADVITSSIKDRCDAIISEFREQLAIEKKEIRDLRTKVLDFKEGIYEKYREHIEELQAISVNDFDDRPLPSDSEIVGNIFNDVKTAIKTEIVSDEKRRQEDDLNNEPPVKEASEKKQITDEEYIESLTNAVSTNEEDNAAEDKQ